MTWTVDSSGTQTAVVGTEEVLDSPTTNGTYAFAVDCSNMANGDVVELRVYNEADGATLRQVFKGAYANVQVNPNKESPPIAVDSGAKFTLKQTAGTARNFPWRVRRI